MTGESLRGRVNAAILVAVLVCNTLHQSQLGGAGSRYNSISFILLAAFVALNAHLNRRLAFAFGVPSAFLVLSLLVNVDDVTSGGLRLTLVTLVGFLLLALNPPPLSRIVWRRLVLTYLIVCLGVSLRFTLAQLSSGLGFANTNFNENPNAAAIFFFWCAALALLVLDGSLRWGLAIAYSSLVLTTGSRAGLVSVGVLWAGIVFARDRALDTSGANKRVRSSSNLTAILGVLAAPFLAWRFAPDSVAYLLGRLSRIGLGFSESQITSRDERWNAALAASSDSLSTLFFGWGAGLSSLVVGGSVHSSYLSAIVMFGWPFMITTVFAVFVLWRYHRALGHGVFGVYLLPIMLHGVVESILFNGLSSLWYILIVISIHYRSIGVRIASPREITDARLVSSGS